MTEQQEAESLQVPLPLMISGDFNESARGGDKNCSAAAREMFSPCHSFPVSYGTSRKLSTKFLGGMKPLNCNSEGKNTLLCKTKGLVKSSTLLSETASAAARDAPRFRVCCIKAAFLCKISQEDTTESFDHTSYRRLIFYLSFGFLRLLLFLLKISKTTPILFLH